MNSNQNTLVQTILEAEKFLILTHVRPDGDAISSSISMYYFLLNQGKDARKIDVVIPSISNDLQFLNSNKIIKKDCSQENYDVLIVFDCSNSVRTKGFDSYSNLAKKIIVIDHHESLAHLIASDYSIVDTSASSCTCIIFREFLKFISNDNLATFLKYISVGILSDTIDLTLNVTDEARKILQYCTENSIDIKSIRKQLQSVDERTKILTQIALNRFVTNHDVGCTFILQSDLLPSEKNLDMVNHKYIIEQILHSINCKSLILLIENEKHEFKGSARTTLTNVDLNQICSVMKEKHYFLQGGGHTNSAGFKIAINSDLKTSLNYTFDLLINAILNS